MAINYWRHVEYLGDGLRAFQCLRCYGRILSTDLSDWRFCPLCGTEWLGQWPPEPERAERERLFRLRCEAIERQPRPTRVWWVVESRYKWTGDAEWSAWTTEAGWKYSGRTTDRREALTMLRHCRELVKQELEDGPGFEREFRLRLINE